MPKWINLENLFVVLSLGIAALFGWGFLTVAGFPPTAVGDNWPLLLVFMIFLFIPFSKKLDFFQLFSFEAKITEVQKGVGEAKDKISDVREDVRHLITQQNAFLFSLQSMNNQVTVNNYDRPRRAQVEAAAAEVANVEPAIPPSEHWSIDDELLASIINEQSSVKEQDKSTGTSEARSKITSWLSSFEDINEVRKLGFGEQAALLRLRVERELRRLLKPHEISVAQTPSNRSVSLSSRRLFQLVADYHPELLDQRESFDVFFRIASAAIHANEVPVEDLETAIYLGERLLSILSRIQP